jgi:hypothetical protein
LQLIKQHEAWHALQARTIPALQARAIQDEFFELYQQMK